MWVAHDTGPVCGGCRMSEVRVHLPYYIRSTVIHNMVGRSVASIYVYTTSAV